MLFKMSSLLPISRSTARKETEHKTSSKKSSEEKRQKQKANVDDFQNYNPVQLKEKNSKSKSAEDDAWELLNA